MNIQTKTKTVSLSIAMGLFIMAHPVFADEPPIPHCDQKFGSIAIVEPETQTYWWRQYDLENPEALIKLYVNQSGCFTLVDRGEGLDMRRGERDLADSDELQVSSNIGKGQLVAADYFLVPDLIAQDANSGGRGVAGAIGGKLGGKLGGLLGGVKTKTLEADTILTLTNARTGVQEATARGQAKKTNMSFGGGGFFAIVGAVGGGYSDTEIGRVVSAAYAEAYTDLVNQVKRNGPPSDAAPMQAYTMAIDSDLYSGPSRGGVVRALRKGMTVYPTGKREGAFMEVKDKFDTQGWVSVEDLQ